jgi:hypothetical protein
LYSVFSLFDLSDLSVMRLLFLLFACHDSAMTLAVPAVAGTAGRDRFCAQTAATGKRRRPQPYLFMQPETYCHRLRTMLYYPAANHRINAMIPEQLPHLSR